MNRIFLDKVFDLLVSIGGANESLKQNFIYVHINEDCTEYRFGGYLGHGGKYRSKTNRVDCYQEDETPERIKIIKELNEVLEKLVID